MNEIILKKNVGDSRSLLHDPYPKNSFHLPYKVEEWIHGNALRDYLRTYTKKNLKTKYGVQLMRLRGITADPHGRNYNGKSEEGESLNRGVLGEIIEKVESGEWPKPMNLLIANIDRLDRRHWKKSLPAFESHYDNEASKENLDDFFQAFLDQMQSILKVCLHFG